MSTLENVRNIYYRGELDTCNYTCSYCPFGRKSSLMDSVADRIALERFIDRIGRWEYQPLRIMLLPYGEAMIHHYYQEGIICLAKMPHVSGVSCQTNLSFSVEGFLMLIRERQADMSKIKLWTSFHPDMVRADHFVSKIHRLQVAGIDVCVGVVGNPSAKKTITELRRLLDPRIYLFVNAMQGLREPLSTEDISFFSGIDNLFEYDRRNAKAFPDSCTGGRESLFIDSEGKMYSCPRSGVAIGNLHDGSGCTFIPSCRRKICDCYIAYSNLSGHALKKMMGEGTLWRIPEKQGIKAIFFDIDGTLTNVEGKVPEQYTKVLAYITSRIPVFLATSLPMGYAHKRLGKLFNLFSGGIFADGGLICYKNECECIPIKNLPDIDETKYRVKSYIWHDSVYKYSVTASGSNEATILEEALKNKYNLYRENRLLTVVDREASKEHGLLKICKMADLRLSEVLAVGNTMHDWPMMAVAGHSCAVLGAEKSLKELSEYILNPDSIPAFFRF